MNIHSRGPADDKENNFFSEWIDFEWIWQQCKGPTCFLCDVFFTGAGGLIVTRQDSQPSLSSSVESDQVHNVQQAVMDVWVIKTNWWVALDFHVKPSAYVSCPWPFVKAKRVVTISSMATKIIHCLLYKDSFLTQITVFFSNISKVHA